MKQKILFISPHLSTGGLPQYLYKQIKTFYDDFEIYCIEWDDITGGVLVVQKNSIKKLLNDKLITLNENKTNIFNIIENIKPNIIHFQEIPETFISHNILDKIYSNNRDYFIVVTTHSSFTEPSNIKYTADKFILCSEWSRKKFASYFKKIPCEVWEYPTKKQKYNKEEAKKELKFDPEYKHILHVGLFTPGKNQKEIIEIARLCQNKKIKFHFVGNQAENFKAYWEPLMKNIPSNCIWWNEREDIDKFYKAADVFYFPSLYELNPLSLKEAISYDLPIFIKKLHTYENTYDSIATYITDNIEINKKILLEYLNIKDNIQTLALHILTDIDTEREIKSMQSLTKLTDYNIKYKPIISKRYTILPPSDTCQYPEKISMEPGNTLTPSHYGCYLGHRNAFEEGIKINPNYLIIFECDAVISVSYSEFINKMEFTYNKTIEDDLLMFSFGFHNNTNIIEKKKDYWIVDRFYGAHAYLIPQKSYNIIKQMYNNSKWNVTDLLFAENLNKYKIGIFEKPLTKQTAGYSILDKIYNNDRY